MFPCAICLLIHLNTFGRLRLPKNVCNSCREGDFKGRKQWRITEAFKRLEAEILSSPKSEFFPAYMKDSWLEPQVVGNYRLLLSSALQKIQPFEYSLKVFHIHLPKEKTWNPLNCICCCTSWRQAFHNTWTRVFMRANCSEGLHTWLLIPCPQHRGEGAAPEHMSQLQHSCCPPAPAQPRHLQGAQQSSTSGLEPNHSTGCSHTRHTSSTLFLPSLTWKGNTPTGSKDTTPQQQLPHNPVFCTGYTNG